MSKLLLNNDVYFSLKISDQQLHFSHVQMAEKFLVSGAAIYLQKEGSEFRFNMTVFQAMSIVHVPQY